MHATGSYRAVTPEDGTAVADRPATRPGVLDNGIGGLVEFAVPNQPYALRAEGMFQRFALKSGRTVGRDVNLFSIGPTIMYQMNQAQT